jgi:sigma-B regulation protein RsbU (phosphoserine phosphatase)
MNRSRVTAAARRAGSSGRLVPHGPPQEQRHGRATETGALTMNTTANPSPDDWQQKLSVIVETMRDMSRHTDPQEMVRAYGERIQQFLPIDRRLSLSRRGLSYPQYRITRSTTWAQEVNPWQEKDRLPLLEGGLLAQLLYGDEPQVFDDLELNPDEPAAAYLSGHRSLLAIPMYDQGEALNMVVLLRQEASAFPKDQIADLVWRSNLFGRATNNLVLKGELQRAYDALDRELKVVGDIQRSLLPAELPQIATLDLAAHYQPAQRAGGDYYDFFPLPDGKWGIFIADVSGHGTPAAVLMAVTHCIAHTHPGPPIPPSKVLDYLNYHLATRYVHLNETFVTAFYGIYDPATRTLRYSCAGHNPPRLKRCQDGSLLSLDGARGLPLGILPEGGYEETAQQLQTGDQIIFYTDGITEARNPQGQLFGTERLDLVLENCSLQAQALLDTLIQSVEEFAGGRPADDDRTIIVARLS